MAFRFLIYAAKTHLENIRVGRNLHKIFVLEALKSPGCKDSDGFALTLGLICGDSLPILWHWLASLQFWVGNKDVRLDLILNLKSILNYST